MTKSFLTESKKKTWLVRLIHEFGFVCYQDNEPLGKDYVFEHLNDNRLDSRYENIALAHQSCNIKKINDYDMKLKAQDLLKKREEAGLKYLEDGAAHENNSSEIEINKVLWSFTQQYVSERIAADTNISFDDTLSELTFIAQQRFGHGSEPTFRKYLKSITCKASQLQVVRDDKNKKIICKRNVLN